MAVFLKGERWWEYGDGMGNLCARGDEAGYVAPGTDDGQARYPSEKDDGKARFALSRSSR